MWAAEGPRPALVVEVTSPQTRKNDLDPKFDFYRMPEGAAVRDRRRPGR